MAMQKRPTESEEEYEKRKRRVKLVMMGAGGGAFVYSPIVYNMDTFNTTALKFRTIDNTGSEGESSDGDMYASNHIDLGATQSIIYDTVNTGDYGYFDVTTKSHVKFTATGASATLTTGTDHSNFFSLKAGVSIHANDLAYVDSHPESIAQLVDGETVSGLTFDLTDIEAFYPGNEGSAETLGRVYDVTDQTFLTYATIANFTSSCRTTFENTNYGASNLRYKQDATGRWLSMADANLIEFTGDSRHVDTGWIPSASEDWTLEVIYDLKHNSAYQENGCGSSYQVWFGGWIDNDLHIKVHNSGYKATHAEGKYHMIASYTAATDRTVIFINNSQKSDTVSGYVQETSSFYLGARNENGTPVWFNESPVGLFKVHKNKAMTATEVATAYAKAKLTYPTLP